MKTRSGKGFPRDWPHSRRARACKKRRGVSSPLVSWFPLEWLRRPTRCPRAPFGKRSRCQSQENADTSDNWEKLQTRADTSGPTRSNDSKSRVIASQTVLEGRSSWLRFTRRKYHCRTMESCTLKRAARSFVLVRARLSLFYIQSVVRSSNARSCNASLNKVENVKKVTVKRDTSWILIKIGKFRYVDFWRQFRSFSWMNELLFNFETQMNYYLILKLMGRMTARCSFLSFD